MDTQEERPVLYTLNPLAAANIIDILECEINEHYARRDHRIVISGVNFKATITVWFDPFRRCHAMTLYYGTKFISSLDISSDQRRITKDQASVWQSLGNISSPEMKAFSYDKYLSDDDCSDLMQLFASLFNVVDSGFTKRAL